MRASGRMQLMYVEGSFAPRYQLVKVTFFFFSTLQTMEQLNLIPLDGDIAVITRKAEDFREMDESISRNFSEILVQTMTCLSKVYNTIKESPYGDPGRQAVS